MGVAWTIDDTLRLRGVSQVRLAPDGARVAFVVSAAVMDETRSEFVGQIHLAAADGGGESRPATFGETSAENPRWSPDGRWLAFTAKRGAKGRTNLFVLPVDGPGEARGLLPETAEGDVGDFRWAPDSGSIAYLFTPIDPDAETRGKTKDDARWIDEGVRCARLHRVAWDGSELTELTDGSRQITDLEWLPDGDALVVCHQKSPSADDWPTAQIARVAADGGAWTALTDGPTAAVQPRPSPDGRWIACAVSDTPPSWAFCARLHIVPASGGAARALPETFDSQPGLLGWSDDGRRLLYSEFRGLSVALWAMEVETGATTLLSDGGGQFHDDFQLDATRTRVGFRIQSPDRPSEAATSALTPFAPTVVSRVNAELAQVPVGTTEVVRWRSRDGQEIEGLLTLPPDHVAGTRLPLLLMVHGGPAGVFQRTFVGGGSVYPTAPLAAQGFAILRANPRGSSGYGAEFRFANRCDWGVGDYEDLMAGVDALVGRGIADPARLGVMGWSYGGYMTSWIVGHTDRFKAASIGAAVTHLTSFTGTSDIPGFLPSYFDGRFWESAEVAARYWRHSPIAYVDRVVTPSLIQHPEGDVRVPISQGYEFYRALRLRGVETRMQVLPRQGHGPHEPKLQRAAQTANLEWFTQRLG